MALERLVELAVSRRNARRMLARGAVESGADHYPFMVVLHTAFLAACPAEVWAFDRPFLPALAAPMLVLLALTMALRYWVIATLGERWNTRVICEPGVAPIRRGPFRFLCHPNYLAVVLELLALPLIHTAWLTAMSFGLANAALLRVRIPVEEAALQRGAAGRPGDAR